VKARRLKIILVVGAKDSGKTTYLEHLVKRAEIRGLSVTGFLSKGDLNKETYYLENLKTNEKLVLASKISWKASTIKRGDYYFSPDTIHDGNQLLKDSRGADLIVLDEFGPLEYNGQGFREGFDFLLKGYSGIFCIAMRPSIYRRLKEEPGNESFFHLFQK
jgi:nucleoside-triphosphatase THEP1